MINKSQTKTTDVLQNHPIILILGIIAAIATICACIIMTFTLVTGTESIDELLGRSMQSRIVGTWMDTTDQSTWSFYKDGIFIINGEIPVQGTYVVEDNILRINLEGLLSIAGPHTYSVNIAGDYLTIQDETGVYTFQKVK